ncbi:hypothetical protein N7492_010236 [Penicillium capsulatum]|uniref:Uncharacterized protein n=1 Tax=Penicillium capsulatum TaxID=69766 RepID=A0A9W9LDQ0_9EURO|nr:hypothetical protein N7492_010236 [Penicillium capsulatum]
MAQLYDKLTSEPCLDIALDCEPYCAVFESFGSRDSFIQTLYDAVLPEIRGLQGKTVAVENLHHIRREQTNNPEIWDSPYGGYLDFVTDQRDLAYWRPYVGQASSLKERISTHHRNIQTGHQDSLHYWVIRIGEGHRKANFIRLWQILFPPGIDDMVKLVNENFLEKVMCRAFESLPPSTLEEFFDPPSGPNGGFSGMGLNVVSPLYQGKSLGAILRHKISQKWDKSPDTDICQWSEARSATRNYTKWTPSARPMLTRRDHYGILRQAVLEKVPLKESFIDINQALPVDADQIPWGLLGEDLEDPVSWFQKVKINFQEQKYLSSEIDEINGRPDSFICPVGTSEASIGIVFGCVPSHGYKPNEDNEPDVFHHLPWGMRESGLDQTNSLIWSANLQKFTLIPDNFQSRPLSTSMIRFMKTATQELISRSKLRVVLMCGGEVQRIVLPDNLSASAKITLRLYRVECSAWVQHDGSRILRLFIQSPSPLTKLWSSDGRVAYQITSLFRFLSGIIDVKIRSSFFESSLVVALIVREWHEEKLGKKPPVSPEDLDPILKLWLAERGFVSDRDLESLAEAANGSLRRAAKVMALFQEKAPGLFSADHSALPHPEEQGLECLDESLFETATDFGILLPENGEALGKSEPLSELDDGELDQGPEVDQDRKRPIQLLKGSKHKGHFIPPSTYDFTIRQVRVQITTPIESIDGFWVQAQLAPPGTKHPHVWAQEATPEDPGSRLALRFGILDSDGNEIGFQYPTSGGWEACFKANRLVDELNGDRAPDISKRPRRHIYVDHRHGPYLEKHPELAKFVGGSYIGNNGEFIPGGRSKRQREEQQDRANKEAKKKKGR